MKKIITAADKFV